jgi:hypothetical protein
MAAKAQLANEIGVDAASLEQGQDPEATEMISQVILMTRRTPRPPAYHELKVLVKKFTDGEKKS